MLDALALLMLLGAGVISLATLFTVLKALFPRLLAGAAAIADAEPARAFGVGLVNALFFGVISLAFAAIIEGLGWEVFVIPLLLVLALLTIAAMMGLAAMAQLVGQRLNPDWPPLRRSIWGGAALTLASLAPVVGWFILFPYALVLGFGAFILSLLRHTGKQAEAL